MSKTPTLKRIDLTKCTKHEGSGCARFGFHPDIDERKQYLAKIYGHWYAGTFSLQWYGHNFNNWGTSGIQLDKPGTNTSAWGELYEIVTPKRKTKRERKATRA